MKTAYLLYDRFTALDITGPHDVLSSVPGAESVFVAEGAGPVRSDRGTLRIVAERSLEEVGAPDVVVVPGGYGTRRLLAHEPLLSWLRNMHETTSWTTSVCTGSLLLAAAGLLEDAPATTHWLTRDTLASLGARPVSDRVVEHGKIITAAGVSSGIDMALRLVQLMHGDEVAQAIQLGIEYDPEPPFDAGSPDKAAPSIVEAVSAVFTAQEAEALDTAAVLSAGVEYLAATSDLAGLQRLLGHADVRTTMRYVHIAGDELHERVERTFVSGPITWLPGSRWGQTGVRVRESSSSTRRRRPSHLFDVRATVESTKIVEAE